MWRKWQAPFCAQCYEEVKNPPCSMISFFMWQGGSNIYTLSEIQSPLLPARPCHTLKLPWPIIIHQDHSGHGQDMMKRRCNWRGGFPLHSTFLFANNTLCILMPQFLIQLIFDIARRETSLPCQTLLLSTRRWYGDRVFSIFVSNQPPSTTSQQCKICNNEAITRVTGGNDKGRGHCAVLQNMVHPNFFFISLH